MFVLNKELREDAESKAPIMTGASDVVGGTKLRQLLRRQIKNKTQAIGGGGQLVFCYFIIFCVQAAAKLS